VPGHGGPTGYLSPRVAPGEIIDPTAGPYTASGTGDAEVIPFPSVWMRPPDSQSDHGVHDERDDDEQDRPRGGA
ncbi:MAG: hypothetical protein L0H64_24120, partial [Pseudonocardia sp.]|nr:hypothetical protein [Pseudonocardia sp.]